MVKIRRSYPRDCTFVNRYFLEKMRGNFKNRFGSQGLSEPVQRIFDILNLDVLNFWRHRCFAVNTEDRYSEQGWYTAAFSFFLLLPHQSLGKQNSFDNKGQVNKKQAKSQYIDMPSTGRSPCHI